MKKILVIPLVILTLSSYAQLSQKGKPYSFSNKTYLKSLVQLPVYELKAINRDSFLKEDEQSASLPLRYSVFENVSINIKDGLNTKLQSGEGEIWQYIIRAPGASSIQLIFKKFVVPQGAKLFIYDGGLKQMAGAFTQSNMQEDSSFVVADFKGDSLIVEYFEPYNKTFSGSVIIGSIGKAYRATVQSASTYDTYIGINCSDGKGWENQKHAVCMIEFSDGQYGYQCSGTLMNNVNKDGTPYFLTACHCISTKSEASTIVVYFNYEEKGCTSDINSSNYYTLSGSTMLTTSSASDYTLLKLKNTPTADYLPYYSGWDASGSTDSSSVGIHHPDGLPKKISVDYNPDVSYSDTISWSDETSSTTTYSMPNTHWQVVFDKGLTYGGSSGSPLFDNNKRAIGQLHGGDDINSFYGKLSYSWTHPSSGYSTLKSYLDPKSTGTLSLDGYYPATNLPDAEFLAEFSQVCLSSRVKFTDNSAFNPTSWKWKFSPDSVTFLDNTSSVSQNPVVAFKTKDSYDVRLTVNNTAGSDSLTLDSLISAGTSLDIEVTSGLYSDSCVVNFDSVVFIASGATSYQWSLRQGSDQYFYISSLTGDSAIVKMLTSVKLDTAFNLTLEVTGTQGSCSDSTQVVYPLLKSSNDDIADAIEITTGTSGPYNNVCASIQDGEPVPPDSTCTGQLSWCDEYGTGLNIVEHSVWFTFVGPQSGIISLASTGFDTELAIYEASSYSDILNGNYTLLAANDDRSGSDYTSLVYNVQVTAGSTYWVQLDGSGGGTEGTFYLTLYDSDVTSVKETSSDGKLTVFPQPSTSKVSIKGKALVANKLNIQVYSILGSLIYEKQYVDNTDETITIDVNNWQNGMYLVKIVSDGNQYLAKVLKE
jgi:PKD repeat protein